MKQIMTLAQYLIDKANSEAYRAGKLTGWKHPKVGKEMIEAVGGMQPLLKQARELELAPSLGKAGKFKADWRDMGEIFRKSTTKFRLFRNFAEEKESKTQENISWN